MCQFQLVHTTFDDDEEGGEKEKKKKNITSPKAVFLPVSFFLLFSCVVSRPIRPSTDEYVGSLEENEHRLAMYRPWQTSSWQTTVGKLTNYPAPWQTN